MTNVNKHFFFNLELVYNLCFLSEGILDWHQINGDVIRCFEIPAILHIKCSCSWYRNQLGYLLHMRLAFFRLDVAKFEKTSHPRSADTFSACLMWWYFAFFTRVFFVFTRKHFVFFTTITKVNSSHIFTYSAGIHLGDIKSFSFKSLKKIIMITTDSRVFGI